LKQRTTFFHRLMQQNRRPFKRFSTSPHFTQIFR